MINLRRLLRDISNGKHTISPVTSPVITIRSREKSELAFTKKRTTSSLSYKSTLEPHLNTSSPGKKFLNTAEAIRIKSSLPSIAQSFKARAQSMASKSIGSGKKIRDIIDMKKSMNDTVVPLDTLLIFAIYGMLLTWGCDVQVDALCQRVGLVSPGNHALFGTRGYE